MMIFKKLALLASLVFGMIIPQISADATTDTKIYAVVQKALHGKKIDRNSLPVILKELKQKISELIDSKKDGEYKQLHEALKELNTENLILAYVQLQKVVSHTPPQTQGYIKSVLKQYGL